MAKAARTTTGSKKTTRSSPKSKSASASAQSQNSRKKSSRRKISSSERPSELPPPSPRREDRERMIQYAAYHIAEKDGFQPGKEQEYWFQAERQIKELFRGQPETPTSEVH